jgi:glycine/D-amino acid oxidase-like deaminating enzyme
VRANARWAASVGFTTDARALCTPVEPGVVAIGGYSGTGNLVGPVAARAAVALLLDGRLPPPYFRVGTG